MIVSAINLHSLNNLDKIKKIDNFHKVLTKEKLSGTCQKEEGFRRIKTERVRGASFLNRKSLLYDNHPHR